MFTLHYRRLQQDETGNVRVMLYCGAFLLTLWGSVVLGSTLKVAVLHGFGKTHRLWEMLQLL